MSAFSKMRRQAMDMALDTALACCQARAAGGASELKN